MLFLSYGNSDELSLLPTVGTPWRIVDNRFRRMASLGRAAFWRHASLVSDLKLNARMPAAGIIPIMAAPCCR